MAAVCLRTARRRQKKRRLLLLAGAAWLLIVRKRRETTRTIWTKEWLLRRDEMGAYETLLSELREEDQSSFLNFLRMTPNLFDDLLMKVTPYIQREDTCFRKAISPGMHLAITMRYLATGETFKSLAYLFRVGNNTIGTIVPETCKAIHTVLKEQNFQCPRTPEAWKRVADEYWALWQFPNCVGSLDGKHVTLRQPACSGSKYFNYKHSFSIILLALVDANYKFIFCDVGSQGRCSDAGVFAESVLQSTLECNTLGLPSAAPLPGKDDPKPFCIIGDDAFPLKEYLMKPYPHRNLNNKQRIYNYRISRARRCVENAFGIMANRFRVLLNPICLGPSKVDLIILACCTLHNMLHTLSPSKYTCAPDEVLDPHGSSQNSTQLPQAHVSGRRSATNSAKDYRDYLCNYFSAEGAVPWQQSMI